MQGDLTASVAEFHAFLADAETAHDPIWKVTGLQGLGFALAYRGEATAAQAAAEAAIEVAAEFGEYVLGLGFSALGVAALAAGDAAAARSAEQTARQYLGVRSATAVTTYARNAEAALADGDLIEARRLADQGVDTTMGWHQMMALTTRARVAIVEGEPERAERDAHEALTRSAEIDARVGVPDILECLADIARDAGSLHEAVRLYGAADAIRQRIGVVRFMVHEPAYQSSISALREAMGENGFESTWTEGTGLATEQAIAYAQRGRGERKRPASGWASLTPAEREVVRLVCEGLGNKDIATRLFVSPRTVQAHLTHVYNKLDLTSRVQLIQEAARHK
jgi:DNA-binding CsgD family transcriptional regulator